MTCLQSSHVCVFTCLCYLCYFLYQTFNTKIEGATVNICNIGLSDLSKNSLLTSLQQNFLPINLVDGNCS